MIVRDICMCCQQKVITIVADQNGGEGPVMVTVGDSEDAQVEEGMFLYYINSCIHLIVSCSA